MRVLGLLTKEELDAMGASSAMNIDKFLERVRGIVELFTPYIFILDTLSKPDRRTGGIVDILVHSAKQTIQWAGREAPHVGSILGVLEPIEGGILGELIGWAIALPFWITGVGVGISSKDPKFAIKSIAGMIPIVSTDIQNTIEAIDSTATNAFNKSANIMDGIRSAAADVQAKSSYLKSLPITNLQTSP